MALGTDIGGVLSPDWALSIAVGPIALAQAVLRRLTHAPGSCITDPTYGFRLRDQIGANSTALEIQQGVTAQCYAEEEVEYAQVQVGLDAGAVQLSIVLFTRDSSEVELTVTASELTLTALMNGSKIWEEAA